MGVKAAKWRGDLENKLGYERVEWRKRTVSMAGFLSPNDHVVMDLGAGSMRLKGLLMPGVKYIPVDYKKTSEQTIVCDFNKSEFPQIYADAIVAAGILGYIDDPYWFLDQICANTSKCIISYKGKEKYTESLLTTNEVISYMKKKGFVLTGNDDTLSEWTIIGCFEKITPKSLCKIKDCTGCGACVNACPKDALSFDYDDEGFFKPICDTKKCIGCNACINKCPQLIESNIPRMETPCLYAAWASNDIRENSSSGGAFFVIASHFIKDGGCVFGARWDEEFNVVFSCAEKENELNDFMHSKYVQSSTVGIFKHVRDKILLGKKVLFVGLPCQVEGLYSYLGNLCNSDLLWTIDLVCFGIPSNKLFHKYLAENYDVSNIRDIVFRDKKAGEGWSPTGYGIYSNDGSEHYPNGDDEYQRAFHGVIFRNKVCEKCNRFQIPRIGDFTLGDFWGIQLHDPTWNDGKGTSLISVNSLKGNKLFEEIKNDFARIENVPVEWAENKGNRYGTDARANHHNKEYFDRLIRRNTFSTSVRRTMSDTYDVGIVCMMNYNIGNNLTNYALYEVISSMGYMPLMIDMPSYVQESSFYNEKGPLFYFLKNPYEPSSIYKANAFWELYEKNNCDQYVLASDQLWRSQFIKTTDFFTTLNWVMPEKKKISYGTSMGIEFDSEDSDFISVVREFLMRFDYVSVREPFAKKALDEWGILSTVVLDPVFLCDRSRFDELAERGRLRIPNDKYVFGYYLDPDTRKETILKDTSDKICDGKYVVVTEPPYSEVNSELLYYTVEPCVEEWIAMVKNSDYIITDSFHGMCFALIYNKPFTIVYEKDNWRGVGRFKDFLEMLGLESRLLLEGCKIDCMEDIDYTIVNRKLLELKKTSHEWLKTSLERGRDGFKAPNSYDYFLKTQNELRKKFEHDERIIKEIKSELFFNGFNNRTVKLNASGKEQTEMVVGWGAGFCFRKNLNYINEYSDIKYVCDNNPALWGTKLTENIICISPADLLKLNNPFVLIMVENAAASISISNSLLDMGITRFEHIYNWIKEIEAK
ncbi:MAG: polysaccharide pyruvyl transferase family protein [Lachnospiraceae bacterium]|nr:polysaccharide pyruvyl transferase family protein [Lachnospiraceae bacterium]